MSLALSDVKHTPCGTIGISLPSGNISGLLVLSIIRCSGDRVLGSTCVSSKPNCVSDCPVSSGGGGVNCDSRFAREILPTNMFAAASCDC